MNVIDEPIVERAPTEARARRGPLVMIVDDMAPLREIMACVLQEVGFDTIAARNGAEAARLLAAGLAPSVILLDVTMPIMDGWQFLDVARPNAPVILMSGAFSERAAPVPSCVVGRLDKPVAADVLLEAVTSALSASSATASPDTVRVRA
jgi:CheY-like chemotaxis protein